VITHSARLNAWPHTLISCGSLSAGSHSPPAYLVLIIGFGSIVFWARSSHFHFAHFCSCHFARRHILLSPYLPLVTVLWNLRNGCGHNLGAFYGFQAAFIANERLSCGFSMMETGVWFAMQWQMSSCLHPPRSACQLRSGYVRISHYASSPRSELVATLFYLG
jgi:hypothetical protein